MRIGAWIGAWDPDVPRALELMRPLGNVVVAEGAWDHVGDIRDIVGPTVPITLRDTWQLYGSDEGINEWLWADPEGLADVLASKMIEVRARFPTDWLILLKDINEPPTTTDDQCRNLNRFTVRFSRIIHNADELHHGLHGGEGNPPGNRADILRRMNLLREAHDVCDFTGWHLYRKRHEPGLYHEYRYQFFPDWWDRKKHLATEGLNIEPGGWRSHGQIVSDEILKIFREMADQWRVDRIESVAYFALKVQSEKHFGTYYGDERIYSWIGEFNALEEEKEEPSMPPYSFRFGFKNYADAHPNDVGTPEMDEISIPFMTAEGPKVLAFQQTTKGKLEWVTGGSVRFYPKV